MAAVKVHELAKSLRKTSAEVVEELKKLGVKGKTPSSSIDDKTVDKIKRALKKPKKAAAAPKKAAPKKAAPQKAAPKKAAPQKAPPKKAAPQKAAPPKAAPKKAKPQTAARGAPVSARPSASMRPHMKKPPKAFSREARQMAKDLLPADDGKPLPEDVAVMKVPDKFKKDIESDKDVKFKAKPGMQRAFQAIRKVDSKRWPDSRGGGRRFHHRGGFHGQAATKAGPKVTAPRKKSLKLPEGATVKEFAELIGVKIPDIIKKFMELGDMPTINQPVDADAALIVADSFDIKIEITAAEDEPDVEEGPEDAAKLVHRAPVITIMGHVDHGKTSLLDALRETNVTETEAGGITQHIGAYKVSLKGKDIVFLDTPGHEAFTAMRARGARVTDIVVLVVAADDGVKPQTVEALDHAKAAGVPVIVAVNKIDKPEADVSKVKTGLSEHGIISEDWGGKDIFVEVSAKKRQGLENLLEMLILQAEVMELKANPDKSARGVIIEARLDKGRGPVATVLIQSGTLRVGDIVLSGVNTGRARALNDDLGQKVSEVGPSTPVEVIGFNAVPEAGDVFVVMKDERKARQVALSRLNKQKVSEVVRTPKLTLDEVYAKIKEGEIKDLNIVIKGDVQGSVEAIKDSLLGITHDEVQVRIIHSSAGGINESDIMLASASNAIILGFNIRPEPKAALLAKAEGVDIRLYNVIYEAIDDVKKALEGLLEPTLEEKVLGRAEVRKTFAASKIGTIAGCYVVDGTISRASDGIRVLRDNVVIYEGKIADLKRFKDDVKTVQVGYECGILVENYNDIKVGDVLENFVVEKIAAKLQ